MFSAVNRVKREFKEVFQTAEVVSGVIKLELVDHVWTDLVAEIQGPEGSPYAGGRFQLKINVPEAYPFCPPKIKFTTYIWHPNVSTITGEICLRLLKEEWVAALTLWNVLTAIQSLLAIPESSESQNAMVSNQYKSYKPYYIVTAVHWTNVYAGGSVTNEDCIEKVARLEEMGVDSLTARLSLSASNWDLVLAIENIFSSDFE